MRMEIDLFIRFCYDIRKDEEFISQKARENTDASFRRALS